MNAFGDFMQFIGILDGQYSDFNQAWYAKFGE